MADDQVSEPRAPDDGLTVYLEVQDVLGLYADIFGCTDQEAADQLRSRGGLEGALGRPGWHARLAGADLAFQAAVLAHGIAEGQYFIEGNKRLSLAAMITFLRLNGHDLSASQQERAQWILDLSAGLSVEEFAALIRSSLVPWSGTSSK